MFFKTPCEEYPRYMNVAQPLKPRIMNVPVNFHSGIVDQHQELLEVKIFLRQVLISAYTGQWSLC